ncbi:MAG: PP0621 family protein [Candidatus Sedimenticola sp. 20ELBAFRAG]
MGLRFLLVVLGVWIIYLFARNYLKNRAKNTKKTVRPTEQMIRCDHCGTHVPESEAVTRNGKTFCSEAHADEQ